MIEYNFAHHPRYGWIAIVHLRQKAWTAKVCDPGDVDKRMTALGYPVRGEGLIALLAKAEEDKKP
jgi:hypothetical protein